MIRTFSTRPDRNDKSLVPVLDSMAALMSRAKRKIHAWRKAGKPWDADSYRHIYEELGLSAVLFRMASRSLDATLKGVSELAALRVAELEGRLEAKTRQSKAKADRIEVDCEKIGKLERKVAKCDERLAVLKTRHESAKPAAKKDAALALLKRALDKRYGLIAEIAALESEIETFRGHIHQHNRKIGSYAHRLERARQQVADPSICFGTKVLFKKQHHLKVSRFADHAEWLKKWRDARSSGFLLVGAAGAPNGNEAERLSVRSDGLFDLELRLPPALKDSAAHRYKAGGTEIAAIDFTALEFNHGHDAVLMALARSQPLSFRFCRDKRGWCIFVTVDERMPEAKFDDGRGCLGVDFNADHLALTLADRFGNPVRTWSIPLVTYGKTADQTKDLVRKACVEVVKIALRYDVPVASEALDFADKKRRLTTEQGPRYARMLSSLAYSSFDAALASACCRSGVWLRRVNPAFTSLIGRTSYASRYGIGTHGAAALAIARRAMKLSERVPGPVGGELALPLDDGGHVTLPRPARIEGRHVWSSWRRLNLGFKKALAARRRAGRHAPRSLADTASLPEGRVTHRDAGGRPPASSIVQTRSVAG